MKLNYIMLPENFQRRPLPGHRYRAKKVDKTFSPMSRAGRRAPGEAKEAATVAGNAEKEEIRAVQFTKFVKTLNRKVAAQRHATPPAGNAGEVDMTPRPMRTSNRIAAVAAWLARAAASRPSSKRDTAKSASDPIWRRAVKRVKMNIANSSSVKVEDMSPPRGPVSQVVDAVDVNNMTQHQTFAGPTTPRLADVNLRDQLHNTDIVQPFSQHTVHDFVPPAFPHVITVPQDVLPGPAIHNHLIRPLWLDTPPALGYAFNGTGPVPNDDEVELERTAIACAYMAMEEPMDIDADFPVAEIDYRNLERTAIACAYAAMDEPMDTTPDNTQGPRTYLVLQDVPPIPGQPGFVGDPPAQHPQFDPAVMFQPPIYETLHPPGYQQFVDHDYRLWPPVRTNTDNQVFPLLPPQEPFIPADYNLPAEEHLPFIPHFHDNAYTPFVVQQLEENVPPVAPIQQQHIIYHQPIAHAFQLQPPVHEGLVVNQHFVQQTLDGQIFGHGTRDHDNTGGNQHAGQEYRGDYQGFFVDLAGDVETRERLNWQAVEEQQLDRAELFGVLFGADGEEDEDEDEDDDDDDDDDENELQIIL